MLPPIHFGTEAYFSVSPCSGISELRAISGLYKFHNTYFSLEPITFLNGINKESGIVVALHKTMLEITVVNDLQMLSYKCMLIPDLIQKCMEVELYRTTINLLSSILKTENIFDFREIYLITDKTIAENNLLKSFVQDDRFRYYFDSNIIIAKNLINAPKFEVKNCRYHLLGLLNI